MAQLPDKKTVKDSLNLYFLINFRYSKSKNKSKNPY